MIRPAGESFDSYPADQALVGTAQMKILFATTVALVLMTGRAGLAAESVSVAAPALKVGDNWTLDETTQRGASGFTRQRVSQTVDRLSSDSMVVANKVADAPTAPQNRVLGLDWSLRLAVDGEPKATARPLSFPMKVGDSWTSDWVDPRRVGNQVSAH